MRSRMTRRGLISTKDRDLAFLEDQMTERKMMFTSIDKRYKTVVVTKQLREQAKKDATEREKLRVTQMKDFMELSDCDLESEDDVNEADDPADPTDIEQIVVSDENEADTENEGVVQKKQRRARKTKGKTIPLNVPDGHHCQNHC